jgi:hypothetical protein
MPKPMTAMSDLTATPQFRLASIIVQVIIGAILVGALITVTLSWSARGQRINRLEDWQASVVQAATNATVTPDSKGQRKLLDTNQVVAAIGALNRTADSCLAASAASALSARCRASRTMRSRSALANVQTILRGEYSSAAKRIAALEATKAAATPDLQCKAIAADSKAAWEGWK